MVEVGVRAPHSLFAGEVAAALQPYVDAGASCLLLSPFAAGGDTESALGGAAEVKGQIG